MLSERSINKIGKHLENEGWTDEEIAEAIESIDTSKRVVNVALPLHFKEEAIHHAYCHCKYVLGLREDSKKYRSAFQDAYTTYLTEAYDNSRGVEGPGGGSHKKANPAGIEVHIFDQLGSKITSDQEKKEIAEKAPAGLIYMGKDKYLQKQFAAIAGKIPPEIVKEIANQYSAAVVSLSNSFLYAFGGYQTKRKFGGRTVYTQGKNDNKTMEFSKKTGNTETDKQKMMQVAYRQIARQMYIICISSIIAGSTALNTEILDEMEKGIEKAIENEWLQSGKQKNKKNKQTEEKPDLKFVLNRKTREKIVESFFNAFNADIMEYGKTAGKEDKSKKPPRYLFLRQVQESIKKWSKNPEPPQTKKPKGPLDILSGP